MVLVAEAEVTGMSTQDTTPALVANVNAPNSVLAIVVNPEEGSTVNTLDPTSSPPAIVVVLVKLGIFNPPLEITTLPETDNKGVVVA